MQCLWYLFAIPNLRKHFAGRNICSVELLIVLLADVSECERGRISVGRCRQVAIYNMLTLFPCLHLYLEIQQHLY